MEIKYVNINNDNDEIDGDYDKGEYLVLTLIIFIIWSRVFKEVLLSNWFRNYAKVNFEILKIDRKPYEGIKRWIEQKCQTRILTFRIWVP